MFNGLAIIKKNRKMLIATSFNEISARYMGTTFGIFWAIFYPLLFLALYATVYTLILRIRLNHYTTFGYVLLIFSGLIPFLGFAEALSSGVSSVTSNKNLIKNTLFPIDLIPVKSVLVASTTMMVGLAILFITVWINGMFHLSQLIIPVVLLLQLLFTIGLIWILSALNVFFTDLAQIITLVNIALMLISPIGYTIDMIPKHLFPLMYPNPLYYLIMLYRDSIILGYVPVDLLLIFTAIAITTFVLGYYIFSNLKGIFADYV